MAFDVRQATGHVHVNTPVHRVSAAVPLELLVPTRRQAVNSMRGGGRH
jgi:hypothetical protein